MTCPQLLLLSSISLGLPQNNLLLFTIRIQDQFQNIYSCSRQRHNLFFYSATKPNERYSTEVRLGCSNHGYHLQTKQREIFSIQYNLVCSKYIVWDPFSESGVQGHSQLHYEFEVSLRYVKSWLQKKKKETKNK